MTTEEIEARLIEIESTLRVLTEAIEKLTGIVKMDQSTLASLVDGLTESLEGKK